MARLSAALRDELRARAVTDPAAQLAAEAGIAVFRVSFAAWVSGDPRELAAIMRDAFVELTALTAAR